MDAATGRSRAAPPDLPLPRQPTDGTRGPPRTYEAKISRQARASHLGITPGWSDRTLACSQGLPSPAPHARVTRTPCAGRRCSARVLNSKDLGTLKAPPYPISSTNGRRTQRLRVPLHPRSFGKTGHPPPFLPVGAPLTAPNGAARFAPREGKEARHLSGGSGTPAGRVPDFYAVTGLDVARVVVAPRAKGRSRAAPHRHYLTEAAKCRSRAAPHRNYLRRGSQNQFKNLTRPNPERA